MERFLTIRLLPAVYLKHHLVKDFSKCASFDLTKREVYLSNIMDLETVLYLLSQLIIQDPRFLFCLTWEGKNYYFEKDGSFRMMVEAPISGI